ncbi:retrovirus-related Pol polyprotein from type-1 retrotransposable element R2, partial [Nephila pilipes]
MESPPTGPPPVSPFKKALYSRVVKKGLYRCQFCEKSFISEDRANKHKFTIHGISPRKTVTSFFPDCPPELCRVCCKGSAPYKTMADHYKFVHNLSISANFQQGPIDTIDVNSTDFVSSTDKHVRNFITKKPASTKPKIISKSNNFSNKPPNCNTTKTRIFNNLKIVARPELRGTGPSNIVPMPTTKPKDNSSSSSIIPSKIIVQAEVHHGPNSQGPHDSNSPKKCSMCPFLAIKHCGLRLYYYQVHGLRKIPKSTTTEENIVSTTSSKNKSPPPSSKIAEIIPVKSVPSKVTKPLSKPMRPKKNSSSKAPPLSSTYSSQIITAISPTPKSQDKDKSPRPVVASHSTISSPSIVPFVSFQGSTLQYSFPIQTRLQCRLRNALPLSARSPAKNPAKHSCLINNLILPPSVIEGDHSVCDICECFSAKTQVAKKNHLDAHARESIKANSSQLLLPPASKIKKKLKSKRIIELSEGPSGNLPLAPPITGVIENANPPAEEIEDINKIDVGKISILSSFSEPLEALLEVDDLEGAQFAFESILNDIITKQYRWNRRKCIRNLVNPSSSFCQLNKEFLRTHFTNTWAPPTILYSYPESSPPSLPPILEILTPEAIAACLQGCENSAPGPDRLSYQHWKTIDPSCSIVAKIFNICIKLKDIPSTWKDSNCILIPKKGDLSSIDNWCPITLSNSIYKLFSKCLARKLQDWCGIHKVLSPCQKGFTPFDGVVEHNFVIGQHLEAARRSHTESFLVWLDISNAFGSIPHNILFSAMSSVGIDQDFIHLIQNLYSNSITKIITNEGLTDPIPLSCGVKQGCPLS